MEGASNPSTLSLVLSSGGARGAYHVGVLKFLAEQRPALRFGIYTGVSAGAINATFLAGHRGSLAEAARDLGRAWSRLTVEQVFHSELLPNSRSTLRSLFTVGVRGWRFVRQIHALVDTTPLKRYLKEVLDFPGIEANIAAGRLRALGLSATNYHTGETITFVEGVPEIAGWQRVMRRSVLERISVEHVMGSASLPLIFPAVQIGEHFYGDGAVRQQAPLAPAIHLGADRVVAIAVRYLGPQPPEPKSFPAGYPSPGQIAGYLFHSIFLDALDADVERFERINRMLQRLPAGSTVPEGVRPIRLLVIRPSRDIARIANEYRGTLSPSLQFLARRLGGTFERDADLMSYLLFSDPYLTRLMEVGYEDTRRQWPEIERFLEA